MKKRYYEFLISDLFFKYTFSAVMEKKLVLFSMFRVIQIEIHQTDEKRKAILINHSVLILVCGKFSILRFPLPSAGYDDGPKAVLQGANVGNG